MFSSRDFKTLIAAIRQLSFGKRVMMQLIQYNRLKLVLRVSIPRTSIEKSYVWAFKCAPQHAIMNYSRSLEGSGNVVFSTGQ